MILSRTLAETIYNAMVVLNNIDGRLDARLNTPDRIHVLQDWHGVVCVYADQQNKEVYADQNEFAQAYNLN